MADEKGTAATIGGIVAGIGGAVVVGGFSLKPPSELIEIWGGFVVFMGIAIVLAPRIFGSAGSQFRAWREVKCPSVVRDDQVQVKLLSCKEDVNSLAMVVRIFSKLPCSLHVDRMSMVVISKAMASDSVPVERYREDWSVEVGKDITEHGSVDVLCRTPLRSDWDYTNTSDFKIIIDHVHCRTARSRLTGVAPVGPVRPHEAKGRIQ